MKLWLIGAGLMAQEYAKVLKELNIQPIVIGRGSSTAKCFETATGFEVIIGGFENYISSFNLENLPDAAIVCTPVNELAAIVSKLIALKVPKILVEKPAGLNAKEIEDLAFQARVAKASVMVGYNRRYYSSVSTAKQMIKNDGGVTSFHFDFTEWAHEIEKLPTDATIKQNWILANSSHVLDLAFYLGGTPEQININHSGHLSWHSAASAFVGSGYTKSGAIFSFHANWDAPGRWGVEVCSKNYRYILRPLERLSVMKRGSIHIEEVDSLNSELDVSFKPGLFLQTQDFLKNTSSNSRCTIYDLEIMLPYYLRIGHYS